MSDQANTVDTTVSTEDAVKAAVLAAQMAIIDAAVRRSREQSWCGEFERIMRELFPDGPPDGSKEFVDSEGWSCRGLDREGFNREGWDADGFNREGYNHSGFDRNGFNADGWDVAGYSRDGFHCETGRDRAGFDRDGVREDGIVRDSDEYRARFRYDRNGYDRDGFNRHGRNRAGLTREQLAEYADVLFVYEWDPTYGLLTVDRVSTDGYGDGGNGSYVGRPADYALYQRLANNIV